MWTTISILTAIATALVVIKVWRTVRLNMKRLREWEEFSRTLDSRDIRAEWALAPKRSFEEYNLGKHLLFVLLLLFFLLKKNSFQNFI
jgi:hypothetical protein